MSNLQRILNLASKALDKKGPPAASRGSGTGSTDWRDLVRTAAEKVAGPTPAASGEVPRDDRYARPAPDARSGSPASDARPAATVSAGGAGAARASAGPTVHADDRRAIARYDYLLATADPAQLELVHREAFSRLTPAQREQVESRLRSELPAHEQPASASADDLARAATRGEAQRPGLLRGLFAEAAPSGTGAGVRSGRGSGAGSALGAAGVGAAAGLGLGAAGGLLAAVAGGAVVSSVAAPLLEQAAGLGVDFEAFSGGLADLAANGLGDVTAGADDLAAGAGDLTSGAGDAVAGLGEQTSGFGEQLRDVGSNFEIPGLGGLGSFFDR